VDIAWKTPPPRTPPLLPSSQLLKMVAVEIAVPVDKS
jgi:hypothetical protein